MARIRTIKPEYWTDEKVGKLKRDERLLFIGLWNIADDQGVVKANPAYIKGQLFSYDEELRVSTVNEWLASLIKARMLVPFAYNGESYYIIRTFEEHQLINRPSKSRFPEELISKILHEGSLNTHGGLSEGSQPEGKGIGKERKDIHADNLPDKKKKTPFVPPTLEEVKAYFLENGYSEACAVKVFRYYNDAGWVDSKGNKVQNWKQKVQGVWFKPENECKAQTPQQEEAPAIDMDEYLGRPKVELPFKHNGR